MSFAPHLGSYCLGFRGFCVVGFRASRFRIAQTPKVSNIIAQNLLKASQKAVLPHVFGVQVAVFWALNLWPVGSLYKTKGGNSARVFSKAGKMAQGLGTVGGLGFEFGARSLLEENWRQPYEGASQYSGALGLAPMRIYTL